MTRKPVIRQPDHELSASARDLLRRFRTAHDDPKVTTAAYVALLLRCQPAMFALDECDRQQLCLAIMEFSVRAITGDPNIVVDAIG